MSQVKSKNTQPEIFVFDSLDTLNIKYEKHYSIEGKPDVAFPEMKVAVFINGEFWHGKNFSKTQKFYSDFWVKKISNNIKRDRRNYRILKNKGWKFVVIWDKQLYKFPKRNINRILRLINRQDLKI